MNEMLNGQSSSEIINDISFDDMMKLLNVRTNDVEQRALAISLTDNNEYYNSDTLGQLFDNLVASYGSTHVKVLPNGVIAAGDTGRDVLLINTNVDPSKTSLLDLYCGKSSTGLDTYKDFASKFFGNNPPAGIVSLDYNTEDSLHSATKAYGALQDLNLDGVVQNGFSYGSGLVFGRTEELLTNYEDVPLKYIVSIDPAGTDLIKGYKLDKINEKNIPIIMLLQEEAGGSVGGTVETNFGAISEQFLKNNPNFDFRNFILTVPENSTVDGDNYTVHGNIPATITENGYLEVLLGLRDSSETNYKCNYYRVKCDENGNPLLDATTNLPILEKIPADVATTLIKYITENGSLITSCKSYVNDRMAAINTNAHNMLNSLNASISAIGKIGINSSLLGEIQSCLGGYCSGFSILADKIKQEVTAINSYAERFADIDIDLSNLAAGMENSPINNRNNDIIM